MPADKLKAMVAWMEDEEIAFDIGAYRDAPDGLRIWCGATVDEADVRLLMKWLAYGYGKFME